TKNPENLSIAPSFPRAVPTEELNSKNLSSPVFICIRCSNFESDSFKLVAGIGNVCDICNSSYDRDIFINNEVVGTMCQSLSLPCQNATRGCKEKINYLDIPKHSSVCMYRNYLCPLNLVEGCIWNSNLPSLLNHCLSTHSNSTIHGYDNCYKLDINISITNDIIKLLYSGSNKFIIHVKCDMETLKLGFIIYYIGDDREGFSAIVELEGHVAIRGRFKINLSDKEFTKDFNTDRAFNIDLALVQQIVQIPVVTTLISIEIPEDKKQGKLNEKLLKFFKCPGCTNFLKPPIYQCLHGHSFCKRCKKKHSKLCVVCKLDIENTRNYILEELSTLVHFPCCYRNHGCQTILPISEIDKHESECSLQLYECPLCNWKGIYFAVMYHLQTSHKDDIIISNFHKVCCSKDETNAVCLFAHGHMFCINYYPDNISFSCAVQLVGPKGYAKMFKYEIGLIDQRNENRKLT
ncbi:hypothetical protein ILUMI_08328, partial [Ignelater luminosus]